MAATTTLLGLVTPTQGTLSGTWGDTVNYGISDYVDISVAGTLTLTNDGAVTLANTTGSSAGSNITSTLTGAGTVTAQFAIVRVTGTLTVAKVITAPSYSKTYTVVNAATGGIVTFKASGQTGVSIAVGESAFVYFNGTDYVKIVGTATAGAAGGSNTQVQFNSSGILAGSSGLTWDGTTLSSTQVNITGQGTLRLQDTTGGEYVGLRSPSALGASYTLTFPADDGTNGQALITDGSGVLSWSTAASGDVYGPGSSTDNAVARFDSTTGKLLQNSVVIIGDTGDVSGVGTLSAATLTLTNALGTAYGGTGLTSFTSGGVVYASSTSALATGSAFTFDGNQVKLTGNPPTINFNSVTSNSARGLLFENSGTQFARLTANFQTGDFRFVSGESGQGGYFFTWFTEAIERMRLTAAGSLVVGGTEVVTNNGGITATTTSSGTTQSTLAMRNAGTANGSGTVLTFRGATNTGAENDYAYLTMVADNTTAKTGSIRFSTGSGSSPTEKVRIDSDGNVGIGTSSPASKLHVSVSANNATSTGRIVNTSSGVNAYSGLYFGNDNSEQNALILLNSSTNTSYGGANSLLIGTNTSAPVVFITNVTEKMRLDSAGNLGLGTVSPTSNGSGNTVLDIASGSANNANLWLHGNNTSGSSTGLQIQSASDLTAYLWNFSNAAMVFGTNNTERARIDSSGNLLVGATSALSFKFKAIGTGGNLAGNAYYVGLFGEGAASNKGVGLGYDSSSQTAIVYAETASAASNLAFWTYSGSAWGERARITSGGDVYVGTTTGTIGTANFGVVLSADGTLLNSRNQGAGVAVLYSGGNAGYFQILGNGNAQNTNNSYGAVSDVKLKENIVDATPKLANLMQVKVRNYNLIGDTTKQIGVVAQELETVFPSMIDATFDKDADGNDLGTTTKSVKYSVFVPMLIKAMQEQQAIIESLKARLDAANL